MSDLYSRSGISVEGLASTNKALAALGEPKEELKKILLDGAEIMAKEAKVQAPKKSNRLAESIRPAATTRGGFVYAGNNRKGKGGVSYANPVHWGWFVDRKSERARKSARGYIKRNIKPNPFMAKALGYTREEIFTNFTKQMKNELDRIIGKYNKRGQ